MGRRAKRPASQFGPTSETCSAEIPFVTMQRQLDNSLPISNPNRIKGLVLQWLISSPSVLCWIGRKASKADYLYAIAARAWSLAVILIVLGLHLQVSEAVKITRMSVPKWVENGTVDSVILDCEYTYTEKDSLLVVKWFLNSDPEPIYQWITEYNTRQASTRLQGHLNMNFMVTPSNHLTRYRALNILRPTTDLSGKYSCHVVSLKSQDTAEQVMTVYAAPKRLDFNYTKSSALGANLTCEADQVFPIPHILLYRLTIHDSEPQLIFEVRSHYDKTSNGAFEAMVSHEILDRSLPSEQPAIYECILSLPGTLYKRQEKIIYYPGSAIDSASSHRAQILLSALVLISAMIWLS